MYIENFWRRYEVCYFPHAKPMHIQVRAWQRICWREDQNSKGDLIREKQVVHATTLDLDSLRKEIPYLRKYVVVISFVEGLDSIVNHKQWLRELEAKIWAKILFQIATGGGFYY